MTEEYDDALAQCEQCHELGAMDEMKQVRMPGATLYFCEDCASKTYSEQVL